MLQFFLCMSDLAREFPLDSPVEPVSGKYLSSRPPSTGPAIAPAGPKEAAQQVQRQSLVEMVNEIQKHQEVSDKDQEKLEKIERHLKDLKEILSFFKQVVLLPRISQTPFTQHQEFVRRNPPSMSRFQKLPGARKIEQHLEDAYQKEVMEDYETIAYLAISPVLPRLHIEVPDYLKSIPSAGMTKESAEARARDLYRHILFHADFCVDALMDISEDVASIAEFGTYANFLRMAGESIANFSQKASPARAYEDAVDQERLIYTHLPGIGLNPVDQQIERNKQLDALENSRTHLLRGAVYFFAGIKEYVRTLMEVLSIQKEKMRKES